jgi:hypothetical protein
MTIGVNSFLMPALAGAKHPKAIARDGMTLGRRQNCSVESLRFGDLPSVVVVDGLMK